MVPCNEQPTLRTALYVVVALLLVLGYCISSSKGTQEEDTSDAAPPAVDNYVACPGHSHVSILDPVCRSLGRGSAGGLMSSSRCEATILRLRQKGLVAHEPSPKAPRVCIAADDDMASHVIRHGKWSDCDILFATVLNAAARVEKNSTRQQHRVIKVWDVGAHVGTCSTPLAASGFDVIAVEQHRKQRELLRASRDVSKVSHETLVVANSLAAVELQSSASEALFYHVIKLDVGGATAKLLSDAFARLDRDNHKVVAVHVELDAKTRVNQGIVDLCAKRGLQLHCVIAEENRLADVDCDKAAHVDHATSIHLVGVVPLL